MAVFLAIVFLALLPATAVGADVHVVDLPRASPVSEYSGTGAYDGASATYHLSVVQGGQLRPLPVAPSPVGFDADIGPDSDGRPAIVFARCADPIQRTGCDVYLVALSGPLAGREQRLSGVSTSGSEYAPTLWRGRIAFARSSRARDPIVYTRMLGQPASIPSKRQPGAVPTRRCEVRYEPGDCTTRARRVVALELSGDLLAIEVGYTVENQVGHSTHEIRLADDRRRTVRRVALMTSGEGGQSFVGLSFAAGWLGWYKTCFGDPSGCIRGGGAFRFAPTSDRYQFAKDRRQFEGFALLNNGSLRVSGDESRGCESDQIFLQGKGPCPLIRTGRLPFRPIAARRVRGGNAP